MAAIDVVSGIASSKSITTAGSLWSIRFSVWNHPPRLTGCSSAGVTPNRGSWTGRCTSERQVRNRTRRADTNVPESILRSAMARLWRVAFWGTCLGSSLSLSCTSSDLSSTAPTPKCEVSVSRLAEAVPAGGATTSLAISTQPECAWDAAPNAPWIADVTPRSGQGNGQLAVRVIANPSPSPRQGNVQVNAEVVPITQEAAPCVFQITPAAREVAAAGGTTTVEVGVLTGCSWTAATDSTWISLRSGATGNGNGVVTLAVDSNPGAARTGLVTVAGRAVTIAQQAIVGPPTPTPPPTPPTPPPPRHRRRRRHHRRRAYSR